MRSGATWILRRGAPVDEPRRQCQSGVPGIMRTGELEGMRSVAPACLSACFVVHMCACNLYDHALRGNVDAAPRRTGVDEPRRQCDQVRRTSCAQASLKYAVSERLSARAHARCAHVRRSAVTHVRLTSQILCHALGIQAAIQRKGGADLAWTSRHCAQAHRCTGSPEKKISGRQWPTSRCRVRAKRAGALATHHGRRDAS